MIKNIIQLFHNWDVKHVFLKPTDVLIPLLRNVVLKLMVDFFLLCFIFWYKKPPPNVLFIIEFDNCETLFVRALL